MNIHPQLFDRWKPLILESRRWRDHTGLSCKSASKMPGTLSAYGNGYGIMPGRAKLTKLTHPYPDIPPSRHGGATQSRFIAELIAFYGDLFAHKARLPSDGSSRECPPMRRDFASLNLLSANTFVKMFNMLTGFTYRGLAPHKFMPPPQDRRDLRHAGQGSRMRGRITFKFSGRKKSRG